MKKQIIKIVTSLILAISVVTSTLPMTVFAVTGTADLNNPSNWFDINENNLGADLLTSTTWAAVTADTSKTAGGITSSLKMYGNNSEAFNINLNVEKNKTYELSFLYNPDNTVYAGTIGGTYVFYGAFIAPYTAGMKVQDLTASANAWAYATTSKRVVGFNGNNYNKVGTCNAEAPTVGSWSRASFTFQSGEQTQYLFSALLSTNVSTCYLSQLKLVEISTAQADADSWVPFAGGSANTQDQNRMTGVDSWVNVKVNTDNKYVSPQNTSGYSLVFNAPYQNYVKKFSVTPQRKYRIAFKGYYDYEVDSSVTTRNNPLQAILVIKQGGSTVWASSDMIAGAGTLTNSRAVWTDYKLDFESGNQTNLSLVLYNINGFYIDCFTITDMGASSPGVSDGATVDIASVVGTSIRCTTPSGIRFKSNIQQSLLDSGYEGYSVIEYGYVVMRTEYLTGSEYLNGAELKLGTSLTLPSGKTITAQQGVAYQKAVGAAAATKDVVFEDHGTSRDFTAVLINIGQRADKSIDYNNYTKAYSTRVYAKLQKDGNIITVYDNDVKSASICDVMKIILHSTNTDSQTIQDKQNVKNLINSQEGLLAVYKTFDADWGSVL